MKGRKIQLASAKMRKVYELIDAVMVGRTWTTKKFDSQFALTSACSFVAQTWFGTRFFTAKTHCRWKRHWPGSGPPSS